MYQFVFKWLTKNNNKCIGLYLNVIIVTWCIGVRPQFRLREKKVSIVRTETDMA